MSSVSAGGGVEEDGASMTLWQECEVCGRSAKGEGRDSYRRGRGEGAGLII